MIPCVNFTVVKPVVFLRWDWFMLLSVGDSRRYSKGIVEWCIWLGHVLHLVSGVFPTSSFTGLKVDDAESGFLFQSPPHPLPLPIIITNFIQVDTPHYQSNISSSRSRTNKCLLHPKAISNDRQPPHTLKSASSPLFITPLEVPDFSGIKWRGFRQSMAVTSLIVYRSVVVVVGTGSRL